MITREFDLRQHFSLPNLLPIESLPPVTTLVNQLSTFCATELDTVFFDSEHVKVVELLLYLNQEADRYFLAAMRQGAIARVFIKGLHQSQIDFVRKQKLAKALRHALNHLPHFRRSNELPEALASAFLDESTMQPQAGHEVMGCILKLLSLVGESRPILLAIARKLSYPILLQLLRSGSQNKVRLAYQVLLVKIEVSLSVYIFSCYEACCSSTDTLVSSKLIVQTFLTSLQRNIRQPYDIEFWERALIFSFKQIEAGDEYFKSATEVACAILSSHGQVLHPILVSYVDSEAWQEVVLPKLMARCESVRLRYLLNLVARLDVRIGYQLNAQPLLVYAQVIAQAENVGIRASSQMSLEEMVYQWAQVATLTQAQQVQLVGAVQTLVKDQVITKANAASWHEVLWPHLDQLLQYHTTLVLKLYQQLFVQIVEQWSAYQVSIELFITHLTRIVQRTQDRGHIRQVHAVISGMIEHAGSTVADVAKFAANAAMHQSIVLSIREPGDIALGLYLVRDAGEQWDVGQKVEILTLIHANFQRFPTDNPRLYQVLVDLIQPSDSIDPSASWSEVAEKATVVIDCLSRFNSDHRDAFTNQVKFIVGVLNALNHCCDPAVRVNFIIHLTRCVQVTDVEDERIGLFTECEGFWRTLVDAFNGQTSRGTDMAPHYLQMLTSQYPDELSDELEANEALRQVLDKVLDVPFSDAGYMLDAIESVGFNAKHVSQASCKKAWELLCLRLESENAPDLNEHATSLLERFLKEPKMLDAITPGMIPWPELHEGKRLLWLLKGACERCPSLANVIAAESKETWDALIDFTDSDLTHADQANQVWALGIVFQKARKVELNKINLEVLIANLVHLMRSRAHRHHAQNAAWTLRTILLKHPEVANEVIAYQPDIWQVLAPLIVQQANQVLRVQAMSILCAVLSVSVEKDSGLVNKIARDHPTLVEVITDVLNTPDIEPSDFISASQILDFLSSEPVCLTECPDLPMKLKRLSLHCATHKKWQVVESVVDLFRVSVTHSSANEQLTLLKALTDKRGKTDAPLFIAHQNIPDPVLCNKLLALRGVVLPLCVKRRTQLAGDLNCQAAIFKLVEMCDLQHRMELMFELAENIQREDFFGIRLLLDFYRSNVSLINWRERGEFFLACLSWLGQYIRPSDPTTAGARAGAGVDIFAESSRDAEPKLYAEVVHLLQFIVVRDPGFAKHLLQQIPYVSVWLQSKNWTEGGVAMPMPQAPRLSLGISKASPLGLLRSYVEGGQDQLDDEAAEALPFTEMECVEVLQKAAAGEMVVEGVEAYARKLTCHAKSCLPGQRDELFMQVEPWLALEIEKSRISSVALRLLVALVDTDKKLALELMNKHPLLLAKFMRDDAVGNFRDGLLWIRLINVVFRCAINYSGWNIKGARRVREKVDRLSCAPNRTLGESQLILQERIDFMRSYSQLEDEYEEVAGYEHARNILAGEEVKIEWGGYLVRCTIC